MSLFSHPFQMWIFFNFASPPQLKSKIAFLSTDNYSKELGKNFIFLIRLKSRFRSTRDIWEYKSIFSNMLLERKREVMRDRSVRSINLILFDLRSKISRFFKLFRLISSSWLNGSLRIVKDEGSCPSLMHFKLFLSSDKEFRWRHLLSQQGN